MPTVMPTRTRQFRLVVAQRKSHPTLDFTSGGCVSYTRLLGGGKVYAGIGIEVSEQGVHHCDYL